MSLENPHCILKQFVKLNINMRPFPPTCHFRFISTKNGSAARLPPRPKPIAASLFMIYRENLLKIPGFEKKHEGVTGITV
jgi:hypothetical protein